MIQITKNHQQLIPRISIGYNNGQQSAYAAGKYPFAGNPIQ